MKYSVVKFSGSFMVWMLSVTCSMAQMTGSSRVIMSLNEQWQFKKADNRRDVSLADGKWKKIDLPHTWNDKDIQSGNGFYAGEAFYEKELWADSMWKNKRVFIRFEGVGQVAQLYVNDKLIGVHKGSYAAFAFDISHALNYGQKNKILVNVSNQENETIIPVNNRLFSIYGGIYRPVSLIITDKVNITVTDHASPGIYIRQKNVTAKSAEIEVSTKLENRTGATAALQLLTTIYDAAGNQVQQVKQPVQLSIQGMQLFVQRITVNKPHLWNGRKDPYLYKVTVAVKEGDRPVDEVTQPLGIRKFEIVPGKGFMLNDQPYRLYGVCRHQEVQDHGNALSNEQHAADLEDIREIGATSIRFAHYQQSEYIYNKCDSMGFIIWAEIPFVNAVSGKESENAKQQLTELIRQQFNHPSIYVWGLHNEVYGKTPGDYAAVLTKELDDIAKTEDPDRYTVSVSGYGEMNRPTNLNADIQGMNRYYGWYEGKIGDLEQWVTGLEKNYPDNKLVLSEYGVEANISQHDETALNRERGNPGAQFWPEEYQTRFHEIQWGIIEKHPYLTASYVWNMFDFAVPPANGGGVPARNMKGLITYDRKVKKDAFYWYKANWSSEPVFYISNRRLTERKQAITSIDVYSNVGVPQLEVNGQKIKTFRQGNTKVQYIFENVALNRGRNTVVITGQADGKTYSDKVEWTLE